MTTLTVQADDTATAMDQIAEKLGADALILSTTKKDGKVIMRASNDRNIIDGRASAKSEQGDFSAMFAAASHTARAGSARTSTDVFSAAAPAAKPSYEPSAQNYSNNAQHAMMQAMTVMAERIEKLESRLSGMVLTNSSGLNDSLQDSTPVQLMRAGFSQNTVIALKSAYASLAYEAGVTSFLDMLAEDLSIVQAEELLKKRVLFVVGPSGSGRTTLAAKLAASLKETHPTKEIVLSSLSTSTHETDTRLRGLGRLLNIPVNHFGPDSNPQDFDKMTDFDMMVVDVTLNHDHAVEKINHLKQHIGATQSAVVMTLSGGSSAKMIHLAMQQFQPLLPVIALTKLDECETTAAEFSALNETGAQIAMLSGTKSVVGAIAFASQKILAQYLKENFVLDENGII